MENNNINEDILQGIQSENDGYTESILDDQIAYLSDEITLSETENNDVLDFLEMDETLTEKQEGVPAKKESSKIFAGFIFTLRYILTSSLIFGVLLVTTNYNAYINIVKSYVFQEEFENRTKSLISSVEASNIKDKLQKEIESKKKIIEDDKDKEKNKYSVKSLVDLTEKEGIDISVEITPYKNRIVIPKIGKNIPLVDVKNRAVSGEKELNNIFMKELENGVVRYPSSAKPGQNGNAFIFGHSSNFPWINGDYNEVFSLLDKVEYDDQIIVYYGQKKFTYKIKEKKVITPGDVSILERDKDKPELTLMTCWPIGTTLNRLIVTGELVEEE